MFAAETIPRNMFSNTNNDNMGKASTEGEFQFLKRKELMVSDLFHQQHLQIPAGLARNRPFSGSFAANSGGAGDDSDALFSSFLSKKDHSQMQYLMKREVGVETTELRREMAVEEGAVDGGGGTVVGCYSSSNHSRQNSSAPGFFYGFDGRDSGNYKIHNPSSGGLSNHISFSTIQESRKESLQAISSLENGPLKINANNVNDQEFDSTFSHETWNDLKTFTSTKGLELNHETGTKTCDLVHNFSLSSLSNDQRSVEKYLHFQHDSMVPCQIRAKRGFATHPRSIAERMRRTRISGKIKKLQEFFPNMNKQTNTADMLDLAVEYIKDLQKQVKTLTDTRAKCVCPRTHRK